MKFYTRNLNEGKIYTRNLNEGKIKHILPSFLKHSNNRSDTITYCIS
ncbi:hypothetical protein HDC90_002716 [Pedobacter sp. AK013]|nr:hypothetical protein [Pedobacter sp. AK013]